MNIVLSEGEDCRQVVRDCIGLKVQRTYEMRQSRYLQLLLNRIVELLELALCQKVQKPLRRLDGFRKVGGHSSLVEIHLFTSFSSNQIHLNCSLNR